MAEAEIDMLADETKEARMARAFCQECAGEVPVGDDGRCFLGHQVNTPGEESPGAETTAGPAPPTDPSREPATSQATARNSGTHEPRTAQQSPTTGPDDDLDDGFDLDSLEAAVAELGLDLDEQDDDEPAADLFGRFEESAETTPSDESHGPPEDGPPQAAEDTPEARERGAVPPLTDTSAETEGRQPEPEPGTAPPQTTTGASDETAPAAETAEDTITGEATPVASDSPTQPDQAASSAQEERPREGEAIEDEATEYEPVDDESVDGDDASLRAAAAEAVAAMQGDDPDEAPSAGPDAAEEAPGPDTEPEPAISDAEGDGQATGAGAGPPAEAATVSPVDPGADQEADRTTTEIPVQQPDEEAEPAPARPATGPERPGTRTESTGVPGTAGPADEPRESPDGRDAEMTEAAETPEDQSEDQPDESSGVDLEHFTARPKSRGGLLRRLFG